MSDIQKRFDGLLSLLNFFSATNELAKQCYADTENEIAFTAPIPNAAYPTVKTVIEIFNLNVSKGTGGDYNSFIEALKNTKYTLVSLWHIDTENGSYTIATSIDGKEFIGISKSPKTLTDIRKEYFMQKEVFEKLGDKPLYDYEANEITFINRKHVQ
ncbi:MAG: hypothetical protein F9K23_16745 [Bacteroidetes bacterium]|nr:MAG: hypothetical protein F9K23_16745 [Bacteroidota bacterium]